ncbi:helix-turn-helix domain-containing protein [Methylobacterium sp.]|uniref:helix-turn-helix domain-containing protein n=1 Tax=Methylobacterium sp. TaxID=409 RepID=UPI003B00B669
MLDCRRRAFRHRRGLTLKALAAAAGTHKGHPSRIERSEKAPSVGTLEAIAQALGTQMAELFGKSAAADLAVADRLIALGAGDCAPTMAACPIACAETARRWRPC